MGDGLRSVFGVVHRTDARTRAAERVAVELRRRLPEDHIVLAPHAPRDHGERVPLVVVGREALFVVEPRDEDGDLVCYQDHWYRREGNVNHALEDSPSLRARRNAGRVRSDLATGGLINVRIEGIVLLTRGRADDVGSSCVPVVAGVDDLVRHVLDGISDTPAPERTQAVANALATNIKLSTV